MDASKIQVLLIEDDEVHADLIRLVFSNHDEYHVSVANSLGTANSQLSTSTPDIVLTDYLLPDGNGTEILTSTAQDLPYPVVVMTGFGDEQMAVDVIKAGALDYVIKSRDALVSLPRTINRILREWKLIISRKQAEGALHSSEKKFRGLFDNALDMILITNKNFEIMDSNQQYLTTLSYSENEQIGFSFLDVIDSDCFSKTESAFLELTRGTKLSHLETVFVSKSGKKIDVEINAAPYIENNEIISIQIICRDIRDRKQQQKEKNWLEQQLQQTQKLQAIGQLTGGIAHDFNNILASIMGYSNLALERFASNENKKLTSYLQEISQAGERARQLIQQMLAFSREGQCTPQALDLTPLVDEVLGMITPIIPSSVEVKFSVSGDIPKVSADPVQFHQVLTNMCINARDAMRGKGKLLISMRKVKNLRESCSTCGQSLHDGYIELEVKDNGEGIKPEVLENIFQPFFTTKEVGRGSGMGLAMVHGILHDHHGHIIVNTELGKGTSFRLYFPLASSIPKVNSPETTASTANQSNKIRVLVVDDESSVGGVIKEILGDDSFDITVETDSQSALAYFANNPTSIDVVVTDQIMPGLTGLELAQYLLKVRPDLPIVMCTGFSDKLDEKSALAAGFKSYLAKPIDQHKLLKVVHELGANRDNIH